MRGMPTAMCHICHARIPLDEIDDHAERFDFFFVPSFVLSLCLSVETFVNVFFQNVLHLWSRLFCWCPFF